MIGARVVPLWRVDCGQHESVTFGLEVEAIDYRNTHNAEHHAPPPPPDECPRCQHPYHRGVCVVEWVEPDGWVMDCGCRG